MLVLTCTLLLSSCGGSGQETKKEPGVTIQDGYSISIDKTEVDFVYNYRDGGSDAIFVNVSFKGDGVLVGYPEGSEHLQDWLTVETVTSDSSTVTFKIDWKYNGGIGLESGVLRFVTGSAQKKKEIYTDLKVNYIFEDELVVSYASDTLDSVTLGNGYSKIGDEYQSRGGSPHKYGETFEVFDEFIISEKTFSVESQALDWEITTSQPWLKIDTYKADYQNKEFVSLIIDSQYANIGDNTGEVIINSVDGTKQHTVKVNVYIDEPETYIWLEDYVKQIEFDGFKGELLKTKSFGLCFHHDLESLIFIPEAQIEPTPGLSLVKSEYKTDRGCYTYYLEMDTTEYTQPFESKEFVINALFPGKKVPYKLDVQVFVDENKLGLSHYSANHTIAKGEKSKASFVVQTTAGDISEFSVTTPQQWITFEVKDSTVEYEINTEKLDLGLHSGKAYIQNGNSQLIFNISTSVVDKLDERNYFQIDASEATLINYGNAILTSFSKTEPVVFVLYNKDIHSNDNKGIFSVNYLSGKIEKLNLGENVEVVSFAVSSSGEYMYILDSKSSEFLTYSIPKGEVVKKMEVEDVSESETVVPFMHFGIEYVQIGYQGVYDTSSWEKISDYINFSVDKIAPSGSYYLDGYGVSRLIYRESKRRFDSEYLWSTRYYAYGFSHDSSKVFSGRYGNSNTPLYIYNIQSEELVNEREISPYTRHAIFNSLGDLIVHKDTSYDEERLVVINRDNSVINEIFFKDVKPLYYHSLTDVETLSVSPDGLKILVFSDDGFIHIFNTYREQ
ncbi:hypothetical protein [Pseudoalteromonas piscicida]|uniref:hypothetical protein n=1 Tax=Pseudoalteromonas piscicida TaxID=43662 RepID=UPI003098242C